MQTEFYELSLMGKAWKVQLSFKTGIVVSSSVTQTTTTHARIINPHTKELTDVEVTNSTAFETSLWLRAADGSESQYSFPGNNIVRNGHSVSVVYITSPNAKYSYAFALMNHTSNGVVFTPMDNKQAVDMSMPQDKGVRTLSLSIVAAFLGYVMSDDNAGVISFFAGLGYLLFDMFLLTHHLHKKISATLMDDFQSLLKKAKQKHYHKITSDIERAKKTLEKEEAS